jgi:hypothetical protein
VTPDTDSDEQQLNRQTDDSSLDSHEEQDSDAEVDQKIRQEIDHNYW